MRRNALHWAAVAVSVLLVEGCGGSGRYRGVGPSVGVGVGFYHHGYGGWGRGYYRGYDDATIEADGGMGMPDMDMGPDIDFDF